MNDAEVQQVERDALERYWKAVELADGVREAWVEAGRPLTVVWANGIESEAPLLKLLRRSELDAARLARAIPTPAKRPGRSPVAVLGPDSLMSPAVQLRKVPLPLAGRDRTGA